MEILATLAQWAHALRFEDLPAEVVLAARSQVFSTLASVHAGYASDLGAPILAAFGQPAGSGARALPSAVETSPAHAAFLMAAWGVVLDFDDIMLGGHTGHSTVLVPLAHAHAVRASGRELLVAQVVANEIAARLGMAAALGPARGQMATQVHLLGAAAALARLQGLDARRFAEALGFALSAPPRPLHPGFLGSDAKVLCAAWPIRMGLDAVAAVQAGLRGNAGIVEAADGFLQTFSRMPVRQFCDGLGSRWHTASNSIKIYPACGYLNGALDATLALVREHDIAPDCVARVDVHASLFTLGMDAHSSAHLDGPRSRISTLTFSTPYVLACAILDRGYGPGALRAERIRDPRIWRLMPRIRLHHDARLSVAALLADIPIGAALRLAPRLGGLRFVLQAGGPALACHLLLRAPAGFARLLWRLCRPARARAGLDLAGACKRLGARVRILTTDGRRYERTVEVPQGFVGTGDGAVRARLAREKYGAQAAAVLGERAALCCAALLDRFEDLSPIEVQELIRLNCRSDHASAAA